MRSCRESRLILPLLALLVVGSCSGIRDGAVTPQPEVEADAEADRSPETPPDSAAVDDGGSAEIPAEIEPGKVPLRLRAEILRAEDRRVVDEPLLAALSSPDASVRALACGALGRIGDPSTRTTLEDRLEDDDPRVRAEAAFALGLLGDPAAVAALARASGDKVAAVRARVADALGLLHDPSSTRALTGLLEDRNAVVVEAACNAVHRFGRADFAVDPLLTLIAEGRREPFIPALRALARAASSPLTLVPRSRVRARRAIAALAGSRSVEARMLVAYGLSNPTLQEEAQLLDELLDDPDARVRVFAAEALGFAAAPVAPYLSRALEDPDDRVALAAVRALSRMRGPDAVDALARILVHDNRLWLRRLAVRALASANPAAAAAMAAGLSRDEEPALRLETARVLQGRTEAASIRIASTLARDENPGVRAAALPGLAASAEPLSSLLQAFLESDDPEIQFGMADLIRLRLREPDRPSEDRADAIALLGRLWDGTSGSSPLRVRRALLDAAAAGADDDTRRILEEGLAAEDYELRLRAARHLAERTGEDPRDRPGAASDRPLEEYVEILRWAETPRAAIVTVERPGFVSDHFTLALHTADAPLAAWNFARLAEEGFYNGREIYRLVPNFIVQSGCPVGDGTGGPGYTIRDEYRPSGFPAGTLGMSSSDKDSAGSQWFITLTDQPRLVGRHTAVGRVVQNLPGVVGLLLPGDRVVAIKIYEGDGTETLPPPGVTP